MSTSFVLFIFILLLSIIGNYGDESLQQVFGNEIYQWNHENLLTQVPLSNALNGVSVIGVYYSASWCGPCKNFTPQLVKFYEQMKKNGNKFEIIFVSGDKSSESFIEYYKQMPWLAVPWLNIPAVNTATVTKFAVQGIPHLVLLDAYDLSIITLNGRDEVLRDPYGLEFPWRPRTLTGLIPSSMKLFLSQQSKAVATRLGNLLNGLLSQFTTKRMLAIISSIGITSFQILKRVLSFIFVK